jgi:16S rRNA (cytosine967-C5)-methyltransferase
MPHKIHPALLTHTETVLTALLEFAHPADKLMSDYFHAHRNLGHTDRGFVAELAFAVLRKKRSLAARCGGEATPRRLLLAALIGQGRNRRELEASLKKPGESEWLATVKAFDAATLAPAEALDLPDWLFERLLSQFGVAETTALAQALQQNAPLDLRINELKTKRAAVLEQFAAEGIRAAAGALSPFAIRLAEKPALARHPLFLGGAFEVQDEGSQLLGLLLNPKRGEMVADFCAGAGGKTLLLGMLMRNTGRLYAFDVSEKRLARLKPRLARSGLSNVHPARIESERDAKIRRLAGKLDKVLVDAPCSGLGTLRRNPDLKWRQTPESIAELTQKQAAILTAAATLVRPGGRLVYATCSLLNEENQQIVDAFLAQHPDFSPCPAHETLPLPNATANTPHLQLLPHRHGTDGFYAALLERRQNA